MVVHDNALWVFGGHTAWTEPDGTEGEKVHDDVWRLDLASLQVLPWCPAMALITALTSGSGAKGLHAMPSCLPGPAGQHHAAFRLAGPGPARLVRHTPTAPGFMQLNSCNGCAVAEGEEGGAGTQPPAQQLCAGPLAAQRLPVWWSHRQAGRQGRHLL